jgi:hypothetical protein
MGPKAPLASLPLSGSGRRDFGASLIIFGILGSGGWILVMCLGALLIHWLEGRPAFYYLGPFLIAIAAIVLVVTVIAAGVVLVEVGSNDHLSESRQPLGNGRKVVGTFLVICGINAGSAWTLATYIVELLIQGMVHPPPIDGIHHDGALLAAAATLALVISGALLIAAGSAANRLTNTRILVAVSLCMTVVAAAGYVFGFSSCLEGK